MGVSGAVLWWEEWQLRILVLASLFVQWLLFLTASKRKLAVPSWFRSILWLAYLGSDALAIYALATLFNRQRRQDCSSAHSNSILEVVWAPILLIHLGGQDTITAYNIEDNELWMRHVVTAVSQVTVAIYVFCKSWPGGYNKLLGASILLFIHGVLRCFEKPWILKRASINSSSGFCPATRRMASNEGNSLEYYVQKARAFFVQADHLPQAQGEGNPVDFQTDLLRQAQRECNLGDFEVSKLFVDFALPYPHRLRLVNAFCVLDGKKAYALLQKGLLDAFDALYTNDKMVIDTVLNPILTSIYILFRCAITMMPMMATLMIPGSHGQAYNVNDVNVTYVLLYFTVVLELLSVFWRKDLLRFFSVLLEKYLLPSNRLQLRLMVSLYSYIRMSAILMPFAAIGLFHKSHREAYNDNAVKVTYALLCCAAVLEFFSFGSFINDVEELYDLAPPLMVSQYSLIGFFARNKRHTKKMCILSFFNCKEFLDQRWSMNSCDSSSDIAELVYKHVKKGWVQQINNVNSYWKFNDRRGQWTLEDNECDQDLDWSLTGPFDECVLLWHIATDFCFYYMGASADHQCATARCNQDDASGQGQRCGAWCERSPYHERAIQCRQISNYMVYLLFVNPEMLVAGTRRDLFMTANDEGEKILKNNESLEKILKAKKPGFKVMLKGAMRRLKEIRRIKDLMPWVNAVRKDILKAENKWLWEIERGVMQQVIATMQPTECTESPLHAENTTQEGFIHDAWTLSEALLALGDEKMWEVIQGVWVEMLCFSASRCRGYLHAKSLGTGGELLTYIWLLLLYMGMETLPERLQRTELSSGGGNASAASSHPQVSTTTRDDIV